MEPNRSDLTPAASTLIIPPTVPILALTGTGSSRRPRGASSAFKRLEHDSGLDDDAIRRDLDDLAEMAAEVDDEPVAEGAASRVGPRPAGMDRNPMLGGIAHNRRHVVLGSRNDHSQRVDLVQAGIMRIRCTVQRLEVELTGDQSSQIVIDAGATLIHGRGWTSRSKRRSKRFQD